MAHFSQLPLLVQLQSKLETQVGADLSLLLLVGSLASEEEVDFWSDLDVLLVLKPHAPIRKEIFESALGTLGLLLAREVHVGKGSLTFRYVLEIDHQIERLDLSVSTYERWSNQVRPTLTHHQLLYGEFKASPILHPKSTASIHYPPSPLEQIDQIWFLLYECVKKFMRKDFLIGLHLLLGLLQEVLVFQMKERDVALQTSIHRHGQAERLPEELDFGQLRYQSNSQILSYLGTLAGHFDEHFLQGITTYESRIDPFLRYLRESNAQIPISPES